VPRQSSTRSSRSSARRSIRSLSILLLRDGCRAVRHPRLKQSVHVTKLSLGEGWSPIAEMRDAHLDEGDHHRLRVPPETAEELFHSSPACPSCGVSSRGFLRVSIATAQVRRFEIEAAAGLVGDGARRADPGPGLIDESGRVQGGADNGPVAWPAQDGRGDARAGGLFTARIEIEHTVAED